MIFSKSRCSERLLTAAAIFIGTLIPVHAETVIKFATLAPSGSTWMKSMEEISKELESKTKGEVKFKFYPGGVSGDEKDVVRKIRLGQLQAAGVTGVGLGEVAPELRVLDAPFLFNKTEEADHIMEAFDKDFNQALESKGFELLGWTEVGFVYMFTNIPVHAPIDLKPVKMWIWEGDPIAEAAFKALNINPIPLSLTDVMTSLQTGLINAVYSSPMAAIALQWFTKTKYLHNYPIAYAAGAVIVSKKTVDSLSKENQKWLLDIGRSHLKQLTAASRKENQLAMAALKKEGLTIVEPSAQAADQYREMGVKARRQLAGRLYSAELLDRIEKSLADFRSAGGARPAAHHEKTK